MNFKMKKLVLTLVSACLVIGFTSCKKDVIEIVNQSEKGTIVEMVLRDAPSTAPNEGGEEIIGNVTDPNEGDDFTKIKNTIKGK